MGKMFSSWINSDSVSNVYLLKAIEKGSVIASDIAHNIGGAQPNLFLKVLSVTRKMVDHTAVKRRSVAVALAIHFFWWKTPVQLNKSARFTEDKCQFAALPPLLRPREEDPREFEKAKAQDGA